MNRLRDQLIDAISAEIRRVFPAGFLGDKDQYDWLFSCYDITEEEDIRWQCVLAEEDLNALDLDNFLFLLLTKYQSTALTYPVAVRNHEASAA